MLPEVIFLSLLIIIVLTLFTNALKFIWKKESFDLIQLAVISYLIAIFLSMFTSKSVNSVVEFIAAGYLFCLFLIIKWYCQFSCNNYKNILNYFVASGILAAIVALIGITVAELKLSDKLVLFYENFPLLGDTFRATGLTRHPIFLGSLLITALFSHLIQKKLDADKWRLKDFIILIILICGVLVSKSKSVFPLVASVFLISANSLKEKEWKIVATLVSLLLVSAYLFLTHFTVADSENLQKVIISEYSSGSYIVSFNGYYIIPTTYFLLKKAALIAWWHHPIFGIGANELINYNTFLFKEGMIPRELPYSPHSTFFGALGEMGITGLFSIIFLFTALIKSVSTYKKRTIKIYFQGFLFFILLEAISGDLMNLRHYWIFFALVSMMKSSNTELS